MTKRLSSQENAKYQRLGEAIIQLLNLEQSKTGRVYTEFGQKTPIGLAKSIVQLMLDQQENELDQYIKQVERAILKNK